jgi:hypothetical protein
MKTRPMDKVLSALLVLSLVQIACGLGAAEPPATETPQPTATQTLTPTVTPTPTKTPRPTRTPNLAATATSEAVNAEVQKYFDLGLLASTDGKFVDYEDYSREWAQLGWYSWVILDDKVSDFFLSARVKWSSAYRNADVSGCGFVFAIQEDGDHYTVFLDRTQILFLNADSASSYSSLVGLTRGTGRVRFNNNPADQPIEADFTILVKDAYTYVMVDGEVVGEYTLSQSKILNGNLGLTTLSGTNKDFGTRCEMTNIHAWIVE